MVHFNIKLQNLELLNLKCVTNAEPILLYLMRQLTTYLDSPNERMSDGSITKRYPKSGATPRVERKKNPLQTAFSAYDTGFYGGL